MLVAAGSGGDGKAVGRVLTDIGCLVKVILPGPGFFMQVSQWRPDLIILGTMKGHSGRAALLRILRNAARTRTVPILTLLESRPSPKAWARLALTDEVVRRPVAPQELAMRVRALLRLRQLTHKTRRTLKRIQEQARIDSVTGLAIHGAFKDRITRELHRAHRYRRPLSVLMADVDHFKLYNDSFGHPAGDRLLRLVGRMVTGQIRKVDFGARYGGDEFSIILPETTKDAAEAVAERLRATIENYAFPHRQAQPLGKVTVSIGVATFPEDAPTEKKLLEAADRALYRAKADGRNLVRGQENLR